MAARRSRSASVLRRLRPPRTAPDPESRGGTRARSKSAPSELIRQVSAGAIAIAEAITVGLLPDLSTVLELALGGRSPRQAGDEAGKAVRVQKWPRR